MRKINYIYVFILLGMFLGCDKDLGSYNYISIDSLLISIPEEIPVQVGGKLVVKPEINTVMHTIEESDLSYEWVTFDKSIVGAKSKKILSTERDLDIVFPLPNGTYESYLKVIQNSTGRIWNTKFIVNVEGQIGKYGWFVLHNKANQAHLDFVEDDPENWNSYPKRYHDFNTLLSDELTKEPLQLDGEGISLANFMNRDATFPQYKYYLYVNTTAKTYKINMSDGYAVNNVKYNFLNETVLGQPSSAEFIIPFAAAAAVAIKDNNLYCYRGQQSLYYNLPYNRESDGSAYNISRYFAAPVGSYLYMLTFDTANKRFMKSSNLNSYAQKISTPSQAFDAEHVDKDLVWMGYTSLFNGQAIAILKGESSYYLARMGFNNVGNFSANSLLDVTDKLTGIADADFFAVDQEYGYLFYISGEKLYQYDMDSKILKVARTFPGRKVSMLKSERMSTFSPLYSVFNTQLERIEPVAYSIILATYDESDPENSGKVEFLRVKGLMGDLTESFPAFEGFGIVADVNYTDR